MILNSEFEKINYYFAEGQRLWAAMSEQVVSRDFYLLWENIQQPKPFAWPETMVPLFGTVYPLPEDDPENNVGRYCWDPTEMCAVLIVENPSWEQKFLLTFDNGLPRVYESEPVLLEQSELRHGEKLEIVYDAIAWLKRCRPECNILELTKKEYLEALAGLEGVHEAMSLKAMRRLPAFSLKKLLRLAAADIPADEISNQLSLPLDGNYGHRPDAILADDAAVVGPVRESHNTIMARTPWEIGRELDFLSFSCKNVYEAEKYYVLSFKNAEFVGASAEHEIAVRFLSDEQLMLNDGDLLRVYRHGRSLRLSQRTFRSDVE